MNIDYEAIAKEAMCIMDRSQQYTNAAHAAAVIEAYEAQKKAPEWVPLDLATVKQGQEVRYSGWGDDTSSQEFVCRYKDRFITAENSHELYPRSSCVVGWLMRAPKPKTVRVRVFKGPLGYGVTIHAHVHGQKYVGEGDIKVRE